LWSAWRQDELYILWRAEKGKKNIVELRLDERHCGEHGGRINYIVEWRDKMKYIVECRDAETG
jgi:hypothetical protein